MQLNLNPQETELLSRLLEAALTDMGREIHHTDRVAFKVALKADEALLEGIVERLRVPTPIA